MALDFHFNDYFWQAQMPVSGWGAAAGGPVTVTFAPQGRDDAPLSAAELALVDWMVAHEAELRAAVLAGIVAAYPDLQASYRNALDDFDAVMPNVALVEDMQALICLEGINVHPVVRDDVPYLGYEFACTWDDEHGLGVLMHGARVVEVGQADTAILLWIAEQDAEGVPEPKGKMGF